jgi:hypothetical protein
MGNDILAGKVQIEEWHRPIVILWFEYNVERTLVAGPFAVLTASSLDTFAMA